MPHRDKASILCIDLLVLPTHAEPFATNTRGAPNVLFPGEIGRLASDFTPAFGSSISEVLSLPDGGRAMGGKAQDTVQQRFDRSVNGQKLTSVLAAVLGLG